MTNKNILKILFIEDLPSDVDLAVLELRKEKLIFEHITVCTRADLIRALEKFKPDLIISDYMMPEFNGLQALMVVKELTPEIPFILCTGSVNEEIAVKCIKQGALDYVIKEHMTRLPFAVKEALEQVRIQKEKKASDLLLRESDEKLQSIFAVAPVGIGLVINRVIMEVNDTFCNIIGYNRSELIGKLSEILYPTREEYEIVGREKYRQIAERGTGSVETIFRCKNGNILNVILSSTPLDRNDYSKGVTFTVLDITSRKKAEDALRLSEEKFRSIAENLSDIIFITDTKGIVKYVSPSCRMFGYDQEEFTGKFFGDFLAEGEIARAMQLFSNAMNSINLANIVSLVFKRKDGTRFFAELSGSVFKVENEIKGVLGLIRDVTEKMNREIELRKLHRAVEQSPVSIVLTDLDGTIEYINPKFCEVTGYSKDELIGRNPRVLSSGEKGKEEYKILWDTIKAGNEWKGELHNKKKNGELYWESASISPIKNEREEISHFIGIKEDITEKKLMEASVLLSEMRYRDLFMNNPFPTYIFDTESLEFIEVNDATVLSYGYTREEFANMSLKDLRLPEDIPELIETVRNLGNKPAHSTNLRHRRKDGTVFPIENTSYVLPEKNGRKTRLSMSLDITERVQAAAQMKLAKEKAEASDNLKTTFLNNISHEVRTPLNGILGFAEIVSQTDISEEEKSESLSMLYESSDRLLNTITSYMDISLITSGSLSVNKKKFIPGQILGRVFDQYKSKCSDRNLELLLKIPAQAEIVSVYSDPEIFQKIISHLLDNAVKFTIKGSIIYGCEINENVLEFFVKDTGIGIGKKSLETIFDNFAKEDRGPLNLSEGSGLGLSISKGLIELIDGKISVESEEGTGPSFSFSIPYLDENKTEPINEELKLKSDRSKCAILVAEDDTNNFYYLQALLKQNTKAEIIHALNGKEAVDIFRNRADICLVLMDIKMPVMNGLEATRLIKSVNPHIPVIAITAYAMAGDEARILGAGCDHYLTKPIDKKQLLEKIAVYI